jgi:UDP-2-acetamido-2,6-beta-L-arabino-hexul-4-ose reductase
MPEELEQTPMSAEFNRHIAVTGSSGFMGQNLVLRLKEAGYLHISEITRATSPSESLKALSTADVIFHLAGVNRPTDPAEFAIGNIGAAETVQQAVAQSKHNPLIIYASTTKATENTDYGRSKREAENVLLALADKATVLAYRLPNVFGKWCKPNYNSAVATFCHNLARGQEITVNGQAPITLIYIDDIITEWLSALLHRNHGSKIISPQTTYDTNIAEVANLLRRFAAARQTSTLEGVGTGLERALYATYISYLPPDQMAYPIKAHTDPRGTFSEMLRTGTTGQFSYFTAHPGITRGGHYHHTKTEKFLVLTGKALFKFRHVMTNETRELITEGGTPVIVDTLPGWSHDITNIGQSELVCMLWANEVFDPNRPDTIQAKVF